MKTFRIRYLTLVILLGSSLASFAQTNFFANLTPGQETVAPVFTTNPGGLSRPASFGNATFVLSADLTQLSMTVTIFNIDVNGLQTPNDSNDNLGNAHIHAGPTAVPGQNAGVVWGFFGTPDNDTSSEFLLTPFSSGVGGTFTSIWNASEGNNTTLTAQLNNIMNGLSYINFHTTQNGGGEIRGQLVIPEPSTTALLALGAVAGAASLCRRARILRK